MNDIRSRLVQCFHTVFPGVPEAQLEKATQDSVKNWDSVATITLVNVIDDEFGVQLDLEQLDELNSFESFHRHIENVLKQR